MLEIMLLDDEQAWNFLSRAALRDAGLESEIHTYTDGEKARAHIESQGCPHVLFLDIRMPGMDGFQFLEYLDRSNQCNDMQVIMLTSSHHPADRTRAMMNPRVLDYVEKPLTREVIDRLLEQMGT